MKKYKCIFSSRDKNRRLVISGLRIDSLTQPIDMTKKEEPFEESQRTTRRRSEIIEEEENENETFYEINDGDNRVYAGKKVEMPNNYFAFINVGTFLKVIPISEWHRFNLKSSYSEYMEDIILENPDIKEKEEDFEEIDYQDKFDDDNSEDEIQIKVEKKLSRAGKKMKNLMKEYEVDDSKALNFEDLREMLGDRKITLKQLINEIKIRYKSIDEKTKEIIRNFIKEECNLLEEENEKFLVLKTL